MCQIKECLCGEKLTRTKRQSYFLSNAKSIFALRIHSFLKAYILFEGNWCQLVFKSLFTLIYSASTHSNLDVLPLCCFIKLNHNESLCSSDFLPFCFFPETVKLPVRTQLDARIPTLSYCKRLSFTVIHVWKNKRASIQEASIFYRHPTAVC